jgi:hypothetical protein
MLSKKSFLVVLGAILVCGFMASPTMAKKLHKHGKHHHHKHHKTA